MYQFRQRIAKKEENNDTLNFLSDLCFFDIIDIKSQKYLKNRGNDCILLLSTVKQVP